MLDLSTMHHAPVSPATSTLSLLIALPLVVKGRLVGICITGMTSCGKLMVSCGTSACSSSPPLDMAAWLAASSRPDSSSESFSDVIEAEVGVLGIAEVGYEEGISAPGNFNGRQEPWLERFLFNLPSLFDLVSSGNIAESVDEPCDTDLEVLAPRVLVLSVLGKSLLLVASPGPNAVSSVSARLCTPYVLCSSYFPEEAAA